MKNTKNASSGEILKRGPPEDFALVILGSGTASTIAAWTFAEQGQRIAVIERKYIGGLCPTSSKKIMHSTASYFRQGK